jgi:hypothetical protein
MCIRLPLLLSNGPFSIPILDLIVSCVIKEEKVFSCLSTPITSHIVDSSGSYKNKDGAKQKTTVGHSVWTSMVRGGSAPQVTGTGKSKVGCKHSLWYERGIETCLQINSHSRSHSLKRTHNMLEGNPLYKGLHSSTVFNPPMHRTL